MRCGIRRPSHQRRYASGAVVDAMDPDCLGLVVNPMEQPVGATACAVRVRGHSNVSSKTGRETVRRSERLRPAVKFVLARYGTRGDVEPSAAVGRELLRGGARSARGSSA